MKSFRSIVVEVKRPKDELTVEAFQLSEMLRDLKEIGIVRLHEGKEIAPLIEEIRLCGALGPHDVGLVKEAWNARFGLG